MKHGQRIRPVGGARRAERWFRTHTFDAVPPSATGEVAERKRRQGARISVVIPTLNEAPTIGSIVHTIRTELMDHHALVDQLVVIDGGSTDGTQAQARHMGADVFDVHDVVPEISPVGGKGDSMWRSVRVATGDIVVWIDADIRNFGPRFITGLVAPMLDDADLAFVKGFYRRPIAFGSVVHPAGGGRVTELLARPLINAFFPELAGFLQPLAGEYAVRRDVAMRLPYFTGYSVEAGLLIDLLADVGLERMAQADLGERLHRNRRLEELAPMAGSIARAILLRAEEQGRARGMLDIIGAPMLARSGYDTLATVPIAELERPPLTLLDVSARLSEAIPSRAD